ncbi:MAG: cysteine dioxygenase [Rhodanobacter sp.]|nr:MAG: cysteine dioxygenase [Rhodanobacter sp.]TAM01501.1 MAG: cysteine dioxygenase [Rhodanobacter sp.]TAM41967.1 MAG: cysteine dioxygenase [Rhodanobacter sp.]TAN27623.1 MAG: cysteine dioxygenase [Rhodanobacter sp.]
MGKPRQTLKTLRAIALEHANVAHPDLASMARDLGQVVHHNSSAMATRLARLHQRGHGLGRWLLAQRTQVPVSVMVMAWPANHCTPVHDHAGLWGLELTLVGAVEVQSWRHDPDSGNLHPLGRDWLGPGDGTWFEGDQNHVHRCRNLSQHEAALTLHVYGGELTRYLAYEQAGASGIWTTQPQQVAVVERLHA